MLSEFRRRVWLPPRAHGEIIEDRTVSFLELFYDLVYVVVIAAAAHTLADDVSWRSFGEFAVIFGLIWIAWINGTLYYELHGREDSRTRFFVFVQMLLLALLAVYTGDAAGDGGTGFAIVFATYLVVLTWLWYTVRLRDREEYMAVTARYLTGMVFTIAVVVVSAFLPNEVRVLVWAFLVVAWLAGTLLMSRDPAMDLDMSATHSMVERFGLFVIIVLGEVVVGVVDGLSDSERTFETIATGMLGLMIGFAYWWSYFDFVGRRLPRDNARDRSRWMAAHFPVTLAIAAAGAAMVSLIEHAEDVKTPTPTAALLSGAVALALVALVLKVRTLSDYDRLPTIYQPLSGAMFVAAAIALFLGWIRPAPWVLALSLLLLLAAVWGYAVWRWLLLENPDDIRPQGAETT